ncbi:DUF6870 family protein [Amphibacillus sp. Q70]|uniref:DUF6870 family protein n=1 Tax=Amphibacillus sp. Q70 TaxID=3453416 RepID=UPI003F848732
MITSKQLGAMSEQNIETLEKNELVNISTINIKNELTHEKKILDFLEQIRNPYCFRCGDVPVRVCFSESGTTLETALQELFIRIRQS